MRLSKTRVISSPTLSAAACGSNPLSLSCQLCSEGDLDGGRDTGLPRPDAAFPRLAAASLTFVSVEVMLSTLITAHSEPAVSFCVQSATAEVMEVGVVVLLLLLGSDGICALVEEAAEDKAMAVSTASEGVVGGVWKKSKGEPKKCANKKINADNRTKKLFCLK